jgi:Flp pilus assembly protein TadG
MTRESDTTGHARSRDGRLTTMSSERGVTMIVVAISIAVLTGLSAFVLDYGVMWLARRQAQNAADAGALAGATALAFDDKTYPPVTTVPLNSATLTAQANTIWDSSAPTVNVSWTCPPFAPYTVGGVAAGYHCVQVDVYRDGTNGSATLPTFFARVFGVTTQGVRATASAVVDVANASKCLRPWMIEDKFSGPDWPTGTYANPPDSYTAPSPSGPGTGYTIADIGTVVTLKEGSPSGTLSPSFYYEVTIDPSCKGGNCYRTAIQSCVDVTHVIGQTLQTLPGNRQGPTNQGVTNLINQDKTATWDPSKKAVVNSCAPGCAPVSPRIVPIAMFSPAEFVSLNRSSGTFNLTIVNLMGFFVQSVDNQGTVTGVLVSDAGDLISGTTVGPTSGFNVVPVLVR